MSPQWWHFTKINKINYLCDGPFDAFLSLVSSVLVTRRPRWTMSATGCVSACRDS